MTVDRLKKSQILQKRSVKTLVHFTPVQNLRSIFSHDLLSRTQCDHHGIKPVVSDQYRYDGKLDYISLSVSFPNYGMFYYKQRDLGYSWSILFVSPDIILDKACQFYPHNAASFKSNSIDRSSAVYLNDMFGDNLRGKLKYDLASYYPVNHQAEIMVHQTIPSDYIQAVVFPNLSDHQKWLSGDGKSVQVNSFYDQKYFSQRYDYRFNK